MLEIEVKLEFAFTPSLALFALSAELIMAVSSSSSANPVASSASKQCVQSSASVGDDSDHEEDQNAVAVDNSAAMSSDESDD